MKETQVTDEQKPTEGWCWYEDQMHYYRGTPLRSLCGPFYLAPDRDHDLSQSISKHGSKLFGACWGCRYELLCEGVRESREEETRRVDAALKEEDEGGDLPPLNFRIVVYDPMPQGSLLAFPNIDATQFEPRTPECERGDHMMCPDNHAEMRREAFEPCRCAHHFMVVARI
jgi:hypothetical protein